MAPPKKNVKMDLGSFLADDSFGGSWADEEVDINSIGVSLDQPTFTTAAPIGGGASTGAGSGPAGSGFDSQGAGFGNDDFRRERKEFPVPDQPPYRARVSNLPWEVDEDGIVRHFEDRMQAKDIISEVVLPKDRDTGKVRGFAFVTFTERDVLEESLNLSMSEFQGRKIYVNVAAPPKESEGDWRSGRGSGLGAARREPAVELDWGSARNTRAELPTRQRSNRNLETGEAAAGGEAGAGSARPPRTQEEKSQTLTGVELPPRQRSTRNIQNDQEGGAPRTPRRQNLNSIGAELPVRERSKRTNSYANNNHNNSPATTTTKPSEPEFDWKRGQALPSNRRASAKKEEKKEEQSQAQGPQKSHFSVLDIEDEEDEEEHVESKAEDKEAPVEQLTKETANLSVGEDNDGWEVVRK
ncbi:Eukaryotic translation initiation factor 4B [Candida viswanathii]|uniref:Eukaryotic translation initiation factor 4B n=1 Tax=Candida viswanathii TaxID=5486 RepID=A0A367XX72_9ASCO|nr:Eukaryotic translation initiation factor 4B [Candida viswanathii]